MSEQIVPESKFATARHNSAQLIQNYEDISKSLLEEYERSNCSEAITVLNDLHDKLLVMIESMKNRFNEQSSAEKVSSTGSKELSKSAKKNSKKKNKKNAAGDTKNLSVDVGKERSEGLASLSEQIGSLGKKIHLWAALEQDMLIQLQRSEDTELLSGVLMYLCDAVFKVILTRCATSPIAERDIELITLAGFLYEIDRHPARQDVLNEALLCIGMSHDELRAVNSIDASCSFSVLHRPPKVLLEELIRTDIGEEKFEEAKKVAIKFRALFEAAPTYRCNSL